MTDFYLSPEDVQLIDEAVFRLFGRNLSNAGRIALENITDNQNQALTLATEANTRLDSLEPRVASAESDIVELKTADQVIDNRLDTLELRSTVGGNGISASFNGTTGVTTISADGTVQAVSSISGTYTATTADEVLLCNGTFTLSLPAAASNVRRRYSVRNTGAGTVTIDPNAAELIDGAATLALTGGQFVTIVCDGTAWFTIG